MLSAELLLLLVAGHEARYPDCPKISSETLGLASTYATSTTTPPRRVRITPDGRVGFAYGDPGSDELVVEFWRDAEIVAVYRTPTTIKSRALNSVEDAVKATQSWLDRAQGRKQ